jgi:Skp family chaperone for outer membrane proteins
MTKFICAALAATALAAPGTGFARQSAQGGTASAIPDGKIAVVKADVFAEKVFELKQKYDQVDSQFKPRFEKIKKMAEELKGLEAELTSGKTVPPEKSRQLQNQYEDLKRRGMREEADLQEDLTRALETVTTPIQEKLAKFMGVYAAQRNIVVVFNLNGASEIGLFAFANPGSDITDDFIAEYNKANPVPGMPAPVAPAAGTPPAKP